MHTKSTAASPLKPEQFRLSPCDDLLVCLLRCPLLRECADNKDFRPAAQPMLLEAVETAEKVKDLR